MATIYQPSQWLMPKNANTDKVGNYSLNFDGTADWINCGEILPLFKYFPIGTAKDTAWSASMWVKGSSAGGFFEIPYVESNALNAFSFGFAFSTYLYFGGKYAGIKIKETGVTVFSTTDWNHIVMTFDGVDHTAVSSYTLYVDNVSIAIELIVPHITDFRTENISIGVAGSDGSAIYWDGQMSEVSLFNYELSAGNVTTLYGSAGAGVGNPMALDVVPVGYWKGDKAALGDEWAVPNQGVSHNYALEFNSEYVTTPPWNGYQGLLASSTDVSGSTHITMSCWFNSTDSLNVMGKVFNCIGVDIKIYHDRVYIAASGPLYRYWDGVTLFDGNWHNLVIYIPNGSPTWTLSDSKVYVDTVELTMIPWGSLTANELTDITGMFRNTVGGGGTMSIKMSNWAYWLSDERANISTIFNNGIPGDLTALSPDVWWKLDADNVTIGSQVDVTDSSGNAVTGSGPNGAFPALVGTDVNAAGGTFAADYSFEFDGVGDLIDIGTSLNLGTTSTISLWLKQDRVDVISVFLGENTYSFDYLLYVGFTHKLYFRITTLYVEFGSADVVAIMDNVTDWIHIMVVRTGDDVELFLNGNSMGTVSGVGAIDDTRFDTIGAKHNGTSPTFGKFNNVACWNSDKSANIGAIYNNGRPADLTSLSPIAWWKLGNEAFWDGSNWTIPDQIGSNDGTSYGNPDLVGEAPQSFANGLSYSMDIDSRLGESGFSDENALSYNMDSEARVEDVPA